LRALRGDRTAQEIAAKHKVYPTQVTTRKRQAIDGLTGVFSDKVNPQFLHFHRPTAAHTDSNVG